MTKRFLQGSLIFIALFGVRICFAQENDILKILVLTPYAFDISKDVQKQFDERNAIIVKGTHVSIEAEKKKRADQLAEFNEQPDYIRSMFDNELKFVDSLSLSNYVSYVTREYIQYRLFHPFKIRVRLVLVSTDKLKPTAENYRTKAETSNCNFIINFPIIKVSNDSGKTVATSTIELYSRKKGAVIYSNQGTGSVEGGKTDYPMCAPGEIDCAIVNSAYEGIINCLQRIVDERQKNR